MHYAVTDTGGFSPNVVQPTAEVLVLLRAEDNATVADVRSRVEDIARGAALMTGTELEIDFVKATSNTVPNHVLGRDAVENLKLLKLPEFSKEDVEFYSKISATNKNGNPGHPIADTIPDFKPVEIVFPASSDVGDVSWIVPTVSLSAPTWPGWYSSTFLAGCCCWKEYTGTQGNTDGWRGNGRSRSGPD